MGIIPTKMEGLDLDRFDARIRGSVEQIRMAFERVGGAQPFGDIPSSEETRELLGLFARLQSEDLRQAVLGLMRAVVETPL